MLQNPHGCTPRPDSYPTSPSEPAYMPLNNFDTIRSYGSAGDELENLPQYSREFVQNISKPNSLYHHTPQINPLGTLRGSTLGSTVSSTLGSALCSPGTATPADTDSLHKPWKDALAHNLKDTYYENNKIQNGLYHLSFSALPRHSLCLGRAAFGHHCFHYHLSYLFSQKLCFHSPNFSNPMKFFYFGSTVDNFLSLSCHFCYSFLASQSKFFQNWNSYGFCDR